MSTQTTEPIAIVGAGLAGLTLARTLQQHKVPFTIYDRSPSLTRHNYGITLYPSTYQPLLSLLNLTEESLLSKTQPSVPGLDLSSYLSQSSFVTKKLPSKAIHINRGALQSLIASSLDIRFSHQVDHLSKTNPPTLYFDKPQEVSPSHIIATDGVHSPVRTAVLPNLKPSVLPFVAINGSKRVSPSKFSETYASVLNGSPVVETQLGTTILRIEATHATDRGDIGVRWTYSRPARGENDAVFAPTRDVQDASKVPDAFFEEITELKSSLHGVWAEVFDAEAMKKDKLLNWLMRIVEPGSEKELTQSTDSAIILIGDAIHAHPIVGGEGANEAIRDAIELGEFIGKNGTKDLGSWYTSVHGRWVDGVERAKRTIAEVHADTATAKM